ncbi:MAG: hypothetical protein A2W61_03430 [Deltaproteobacteria bacterium RIFCSPLOWO2_01_44_7]|nr:MAG: hypothetical protein A2712_03655 [Deltaproteobacteria bacterium RIFCSPHIGHO2_01_FULL_43_49]OGQ16286.1 MAG: hypothetical protein A3D22_01625 [Deltaproteobacteria bacterium RIFCSPHIGHO2_02_FULL_44_53]OGQ29246.1 MAG: hypothetical protein A3D98_05410 [Deltaproteobacteria bacterium RIFCSPHIGHO2_12_FULL_44_21]OGQ32803.1 MAG: hypothetical protein A2979_09555 [Deltaproteobacteria bacterium RIFCSPLOWO2_01_FULL_45_74]OGQ41453.1 MAG: hypothetical protein A2W61_03430 [Deltaproteobacteria bacterium 
MKKNILFFLLTSFLVLGSTESLKADTLGLPKEFCGRSTGEACKTDTDCQTGGCSGEVCQGKKEKPVITICEYRACYRADSFRVKCGCVEKKCQWN